MSSVGQGPSIELYRDLCEQAGKDPAYMHSTMEHAAKLALLIYNDAPNASKYRSELSNLANLVVEFIATYYYNHRLSRVKLQTTGIEAVSKNTLHVLKNIYNIVKKYSPTPSSFRFRISNPLRKSGRLTIIKASTQLCDEHEGFQLGVLKVPIPHGQPASRSNAEAPNPIHNDSDRISTSSLDVQSQTSPIYLSSQCSVRPEVESVMVPTLWTEVNSTQQDTVAPSEAGIDFNYNRMASPDLEDRESAFPSPTQETRYDNNIPPDMEIVPCYIEDDEMMEGESDGSQSEEVEENICPPQQKYPSSSLQDLLGPNINTPPGPIVVTHSGNSQWNTNRVVIRREL